MNANTISTIAAAGLLVFSQAALAQNYPDRSITMVVPFAAGGPSDVVARIVAEGMSKHLKQSIVIENIGGAGGTTGSARVAAAEPNGYMLLSSSMGSHVAAPSLYSNLKYDTRKDFEPIGMVMGGPAVVVARNQVPSKNLQEFISYVKANPGKVSQGHGGVGATSHMACLLFNLEAGINPNVVAYRGSAPALNDVVSGHIDYICDSTMGIAEQIKSGSVKAFAITSPDRVAALPEVPTSKEAGLPKYDMSVWAAVFAPKGTPKPILDKLSDALTKALDDKYVIERIEQLGGIVPSKQERTPAYLAQAVDTDITRWEPILKSAVSAAQAAVEDKK